MSKFLKLSFLIVITFLSFSCSDDDLIKCYELDVAQDPSIVISCETLQQDFDCSCD